MVSFGREFAFALISILLSGWLSITSFTYSYDSSVLLRALSLCMLGLSVGYLIRVLVKNKKDAEKSLQDGQPSSVLPALIVFGLVIGCGLLIPVLGFFASFLIFIFVAQVIIGKKFKPIYLVNALGLSLFIFVLFFGFLGVSLPVSLIPIDAFIKVI